MSEDQTRRIRKMQRTWGERLHENSSLRDELDDEQAKQVMQWGMDRLLAAAMEAAALSETEADALMRDTYSNLTRVIRQINTLTATLPYVVDGDQAQVLIEAFMGSACEVLDKQQDVTWIEDLAENYEAMDSQAIFNHLFAFLKD